MSFKPRQEIFLRVPNTNARSVEPPQIDLGREDHLIGMIICVPRSYSKDLVQQSPLALAVTYEGEESV